MAKLCLGSAQFGMQYGLFSKGRPSEDEVFEILNYARNNGIEYFDTAAAYGNAEELLGNSRTIVKIITKIKPVSLLDNPNVAEEIKKSTERIGKRPYGVLLHTPECIYDKEIVEQLKKAKKDGFTDNIGVSVYEVKHGMDAAKMGFDIIQIPYSVLDQRFDTCDFFQICRDNDVKVFARSPFLQGLLLADTKEIPDSMAYAIPYVTKFQEIANSWGIEYNEACLLFCLYKKPNIYSVIFGVDNLQQLKEDVEIYKNVYAGFDDFWQIIKHEFKDIPRAVILPSLWKEQK